MKENDIPDMHVHCNFCGVDASTAKFLFCGSSTICELCLGEALAMLVKCAGQVAVDSMMRRFLYVRDNSTVSDSLESTN